MTLDKGQDILLPKMKREFMEIISTTPLKWSVITTYAQMECACLK